MGNRSFVCGQDFTKTNIHEFKKNVLKYILASKHEYENLDEFYKGLTEKEIKQIKREAVALHISDLEVNGLQESVKFEYDEIILDWDDWKIQGYWYDDFCELCFYLWHSGLRGEINLSYQGYQDYIIRFEEDTIYVDFYEEQDYDEKTETYSPEEPKLEETFKLTTLYRGNYNLPFDWG